MAFKLTTSVGQGGRNSNAGDNIWVQMMLNKFIVPGCLPGLRPLGTDGVVGPKTIAAIKRFQTDIVGFQNPDGRVDPGGATLAALDGPLKWPKKPSAVDGDTGGESGDTTTSTLWGLLQLKWFTVHHGVTKLDFELYNAASQRAHRLVFSGTGKCILRPEAMHVVRRWQDAGQYMRFFTKRAATFGDFKASAKITPTGMHHNLTIINDRGVLADVHLWQYVHSKGRLHPDKPLVRLDECEIVLIGSCRVEYGSGASRPEIWYR